MKHLFLFVGGIIMSVQGLADSGVYSQTVKTIEGTKAPLSAYSGKVTLIVNTASKCGYTEQYKGLETIYEKYKAKGFVVLGFPSNDFGGQEPGSNAEIKQFCTKNFNVSFPLFEKDAVKGEKMQPLYAYLTGKTDPKFQGEVKWNFEKFLVNKKGQVIARFKSGVKPESEELTGQIEKALN